MTRRVGRLVAFPFALGATFLLDAALTALGAPTFDRGVLCGVFTWELWQLLASIGVETE